jgi:hypothetical protein
MRINRTEPSTSFGVPCGVLHQIRNLRQLETFIFVHRCLMCRVQLERGMGNIRPIIMRNVSGNHLGKNSIDHGTKTIKVILEFM